MSNSIKNKINGHDYEIGYLPAMYNTNLFIKFTSIIGGSLSKFFSIFNNTDDWGAIGEGINKIMTSLYVNDANGDIILEILSQTTRDGVPINKVTFDQFYTGNIGEMTEILFESMQVHFKPFLQIDRLSGFLKNPEKGVINSAAN
jgi:hypothetical protein